MSFRASRLESPRPGPKLLPHPAASRVTLSGFTRSHRVEDEDDLPLMYCCLRCLNSLCAILFCALRWVWLLSSFLRPFAGALPPFSAANYRKWQDYTVSIDPVVSELGMVLAEAGREGPGDRVTEGGELERTSSSSSDDPSGSNESCRCGAIKD